MNWDRGYEIDGFCFIEVDENYPEKAGHIMSPIRTGDYCGEDAIQYEQQVVER
jgi:hypothetical protein